MSVPRGVVHGLLGPNGAGKSTTFRIITGLTQFDGGQVIVFGRSIPSELYYVMRNVGVIDENPHFLSDMSALANLRLLAYSSGIDRRQIPIVLERVKLINRSDDLVRSYSHGMKQRLAIVAAMLKEPDIFLFDEPTNGLDPEGTVMLRNIVNELRAFGKTILISSHDLSEMEKLADTISIIMKGKLLTEGTLSDIQMNYGMTIEIITSSAEAACMHLRDAGLRVERQQNRILVFNQNNSDLITDLLNHFGIPILYMQVQKASLEDIFLDLAITNNSETKTTISHP